MNHNLKKLSKLYNRDDLLVYVKNILPDPFSFIDSGTAYGKQIRELEYISRPLWVVFSLIASGEYDESLILPYIRKIKLELKNTDNSIFLKPTTKTRQIAVEMAVYGYGLLACKDKLFSYFDEKEITCLTNWLYLINEIEFPYGNWYFFLLIVNYGLKENNFRYSQAMIDQAWLKIESLYLENGWYQDGDYCQRDYYIAFAFHFYSLILVKYVKGIDCNKLISRSQKFAKDFYYWIDDQGRTIPFGRSLIYRFGYVAFWSGQIISNSYKFDLGIIKDFIFSNLEFWSKQNILSNNRLSIGYSYENLLISEDYNSNGSPGWAFKSFILLSLDSTHPFWQVKRKKREKSLTIKVQKNPGFLIVSGKDHHYALSLMQFSNPALLQTNCKYGKFCYSTRFGWNLSRDVHGINNFAVDNALAISIAGTQQYNSRNLIIDYSCNQEYGYCYWKYGNIADIESWLIPVDEDYHIRIHRIKTKMHLEIYEGAFSVFGWNSKFNYPLIKSDSIVLENCGMVSGIKDINDNRITKVVSQNPNTNIYNFEKNAIPCLMGKIDPGISVFGCVVYGNFHNQKKLDLSVSFKNKLVTFNNKKIHLKEY